MMAESEDQRITAAGLLDQAAAQLFEASELLEPSERRLSAAVASLFLATDNLSIRVLEGVAGEASHVGHDPTDSDAAEVE